MLGRPVLFFIRLQLAQVCKAAPWAFGHTFTKFYQVDICAAEDSPFSHHVLQAAFEVITFLGMMIGG